MVESRPHPRPRWVIVLGFALAYLLCQQASWSLSVANGTYVSIWLPAGFFVAALLLAATADWPWLIAAAGVVNVSLDVHNGTAVGLATAFAIANTLQTVVGAALVRRFVGRSPRLTTLREFLGLVFFTVILSPVLGATIGAVVVVEAGLGTSYPIAWRVWWAGNAIAVLTMAPLVLAWSPPTAPDARWWRRPVRVLEAALAVGCVILLVRRMTGAGHGILAPSNSLLVPLILWAALRFGVRGAAAINLLLSVLLVYFSADYIKGLSPDQLLSGTYTYVLYGFLAFWAASGLIPAIVIAERDEVLRQLGESEDRFRNLAIAANEGVVITEGGRILDVNDQALQLFGYAERAEMISRPLTEFVSEATRPIVAEAIATGRETPYEHQLLRQDGSTFDAEAQAKIIRLRDRPVRMTAIRDISLRKQAEALLLGQQQVLELIAAGRPLADTLSVLIQVVEAQDQGLAGAVLLVDDGRLRDCAAPSLPAEFRRAVDGVAIGENCGSCGTAAHRRQPVIVEDVAHDPLWTGFAPLALAHGLQACWSIPIFDRGQRLLGTFSLYCRRQGPPSARHRQLINVATHLAAVAISRHQDEAALKLSDFSVSQASTATLWIAQDARLIRANRAACVLLGYTEEELLAKSVPDLDQDYPLAAWTEHWQDARERKQLHLETRLRHQQGHFLTVDLHINWLEFEGKEYHFVFLDDLTERRQLEEQFRQAQKLEAIGTLAGGIAHDFNNILTSLIGYTELAKRRNAGDPVTREYLDAVLQGSTRAVELVRQILIFSQRQALPRRPVQLRDAVAEALKLLRATLPASIEFDVELEPDLPPVLADPTQIHQVVVNLCTNARQAIDDGPGRLTVRLDLALVTGGGQRPAAGPAPAPGTYVRLTVADTGCGMDAATLARMFEPFFTTKPVGKGTGLGLAVVHGIVQSHGGSIATDSRPGEGTVFHIYLPALAGEVGSLNPSALLAPEPSVGRGERILLVDDEGPLVQLGEAVLRRLGYVVHGLTVPAEALAAVRARPDAFDLVITDFAMPGIRGTDLARQLKLIRPDLNVILSTGHATGLTAEQALASGVFEVLPKPYTGEELAAAVSRALGRQT